MYTQRSPHKKDSVKAKLRDLPITLYGMVSGTGKRQGRAKAPGVIRPWWGISHSKHLAETATLFPVIDFLPVAWYFCLTANPFEECVWTGARASNSSQNCAFSALKVSFSFFVVAGNINGKSRTQANGEDMVVGQACQERLSRRVDHSRAAGVASGQPLLPMWEPGCCKAMNWMSAWLPAHSPDGAHTAVEGEELMSCSGFPQPSKTRGDWGCGLWCWCYR